VVCWDDPSVAVVAFAAAQIPDIAVPPLCRGGALPEGIPIEDGPELEGLEGDASST